MPECCYPDCGDLVVRTHWVQARGEMLPLCSLHADWDGTPPEPTRDEALATARAALVAAKHTEEDA